MNQDERQTAAWKIHKDKLPVFVKPSEVGDNVQHAFERVGLKARSNGGIKEIEVKSNMCIMDIAKHVDQGYYLRLKHTEDSNFIYGLIIEHMSNMAHAVSDPMINFKAPIDDLAKLDKLCRFLIDQYMRDTDPEKLKAKLEREHRKFNGNRMQRTVNRREIEVKETISHDNSNFRRIINSSVRNRF